MGEVIELTPAETVGFERAQVDALYGDLGPARAEDILCRALHQMMSRLERADAGFRAENTVAAQKHLRRLAVMSDQIGLTSLGHCARAVQQAMKQKDRIATAATLVRLHRNMRKSIATLGELRDLSI